MQWKPDQLRQAITSGARYLPGEGAYEQGNGLMQVGAAWDVLKQNVKTVDITSSAPVNTVLSGLLATPNRGEGIYEREGWAAGQSGTRTITFSSPGRRASAARSPTTYPGSERRDVLERRVDLPAPRDAREPARLDPCGDGRDPQRAAAAERPVHRRDRLHGAEHDRRGEPVRRGEQLQRDHGRIGRPARHGDLLLQRRAEHAGVQGRPDEHQRASASMAAQPARAPYRLAELPDRRHPVPVGRQSDGRGLGGRGRGLADLRGRAGDLRHHRLSPRVDVSPASWTVDPATDGTTYDQTFSFTNRFGAFTGNAVGTALGSAELNHATIAPGGGQQQYPLTVPAGSTQLTAQIGKASDAGADLDLFVFDCHPGSCKLAGSSTSSTANESVSIANPAAGAWVVVVDPFAVPSGSTTYDETDVIRNPAFGSASVTDPAAANPNGSSWSAPASVTPLAAPAAGRFLQGFVQVRSGSTVLGSAEVDLTNVH